MRAFTTLVPLCTRRRRLARAVAPLRKSTVASFVSLAFRSHAAVANVTAGNTNSPRSASAATVLACANASGGTRNHHNAAANATLPTPAAISPALRAQRKIRVRAILVESFPPLRCHDAKCAARCASVSMRHPPVGVNARPIVGGLARRGQPRQHDLQCARVALGCRSSVSQVLSALRVPGRPQSASENRDDAHKRALAPARRAAACVRFFSEAIICACRPHASPRSCMVRSGFVRQRRRRPTAKQAEH